MRFSAVLVAATAALPAFAQDARVPFATFNPGACYYAQRWIDHMANWGKTDRTVYTARKDTTSRLAADSMRVCGASFGTATSDEAQSLNMARMHYMAGADADARAMAQRYLRSMGASAAEKRAWALYLVASDALQAKPARFSDARAALAELDKLPAAGPADRAVMPRARLLAHYELLQAAKRNQDDRTVATAARVVIAEWRKLPAPIGLLTALPLTFSFVAAGEIEQRAGNVAAAKAIIDSGDKTVPLNAGMMRTFMTAHKNLYPLLGGKAAPIEARFWFPTQGTAAVPAPGRARILAFVSHACGGCGAQYAGLHRFGARFGSRIDFVSVTRTRGYYSDVAPVAPEAEASWDSTYFLGRKGLPGTLAVLESQHSFIPDGRRVDHPSIQDKNYPGAGLIVIDKRGVIRYVAAMVNPWDQQIEESLAKFVEALISEP